MEGVSVAVLIVVAAFAIERVTSAILFLLSFNDGWNEFMPDLRLVPDEAERIQQERRQKLVSVALAGALAVFLVFFFGIEILDRLGMSVPSFLDQLFSAAVLVGGSDQIRGLFKGPASPGPALAANSIQVSGTLTLKEPERHTASK